MRNLSFVLFLTILSCSDSTGTDGIRNHLLSLEDADQVETEIASDGSTAGTIPISEEKPQALVASSSSTISGSSVIFPPGALAIASDVKIEEGIDIFQVGVSLDAEVLAGATNATSSVLVSSTAPILATASNPLVITLPILPTGLKLASGNLVVLYAIDAESGRKFGSIPADATFIILADKISFPFSSIDKFSKITAQAKYLVQAVTKEESVVVPTATETTSKSEAAAAPSPEPSSSTTDPTPTVSSCSTAGGKELAGGCWFLAAKGTGCDATCSAVGLSYDVVTRNYAEDLGTRKQCQAVLDLFPVDAAGSALPTGDPLAIQSAWGCRFQSVSPGLGRYWHFGGEALSSAASSKTQRVCACK